MSELKPCPICGATLKIYSPEDWKPTFYDPDSGGDPYNAVCDCGFQYSSGSYDYAEFVAALNRRAQPANEPLTLEELRGMVGEWVWVEHMESPASFAAPGEWLKLKMCAPTRLDPYIWFDGERKGLCAIYYGQSWLAYRRKAEEGNA